MKRYLLIATASLLTGALATDARAETLKWNVRSRFGMSAQGIRRAIVEAKAHFNKKPNDVVVLEFDEGSFYLEDKSSSKGAIDLSGVRPGPHGRLVFQGKGVDKTTLVFSDNKHALYGRDVYRVTMADMHMTRKNYTVSQGLVVATASGRVVLEIQEGFPTPAMIFNPLSDQGRFLRRYTNSRTDPQLVQGDNEQIPWTRARHLDGRRWEIQLKRRNQLVNYPEGALIGIKSKHGGDTEFGGQAYWFMGGSDFLFESVKWTHKSRGVFRGGFEKVQFVDCVIDRAAAINGQTPCLATPGGGPQIGQPNNPATSGHLIKNCRFIALGDDAVAFFNATGTITGCYIRDSFVRGILVANAPRTVLENNTVIRCLVQQSKDWRFHKKGTKPNKATPRDGATPSTNSLILENTRFERQGFTIPCYSYADQKDLETSLRDAAKTGANSVILDYHLLLAGGRTGSHVQMLFPLDRLAEEITVATGLGFYTMIKPVLIVGGYRDPNHTNWQRIAPADPDAWFKSYTAQLTAFVRLPEAERIDALLLGNELHSMTTNADYKARWKKLISGIRPLFTGKIGYNAGGLIGPFKASREYLRITFADSLDFIGISAYPRLSKEFDADANDYRRGWRNSAYGEDLVKRLTDFIARQKKDVYLTELGSPATRGGAYFLNPFEPMEYDLAQQAAFFDASLDVLATVKGLRGVFIYDWHANAGKKLGFTPEANPDYAWICRVGRANPVIGGPAVAQGNSE